MADVNEILLSGNLVSDMELRQKGDVAYGLFSLAVNKNKKDSNGEWKSSPTFFNNIALFGTRAKTLSPYLLKGTKVFIKGHLAINTFEKNGTKLTTVIIRVDNIQFLKSASKDNNFDTSETENLAQEAFAVPSDEDSSDENIEIY